jgi:hypothetical protein
MLKHALTITALLCETAIGRPALAEDARPPTRDESIDLCVAAKEITFQCKDEMADHFAAMAPADKRDVVRAKVLKELVEESTGPLEPRRAKCGADYDRGQRIGRLTPADLANTKACAAREADCKARVSCWMSLAKPRKK